MSDVGPQNDWPGSKRRSERYEFAAGLADAQRDKPDADDIEQEPCRASRRFSISGPIP
jgi:hypothetical protein